MPKNSKNSAKAAAIEAAAIETAAIETAAIETAAIETAEERAFKKPVLTLYYKAEPKKEIPSEIGKAVSLSYLKPGVAEARKTRRGCFAGKDGEDAKYYDSVEKAFRGLGLFPAKVSAGTVIKFRGKLRDVKQDVFTLRNPANGEVIESYYFSDTLPPKERREASEAKPKDETAK